MLALVNRPPFPDEASSKATAATVLQKAKESLYAARGLRAPTAAVARSTVDMYWQHMGGKEFPLRTQVSERSHARVQAAHSEMHLLFYRPAHAHHRGSRWGRERSSPQ